jgi:L-ascorbate metabolism protein UlaG (beta-lactamase superfamily)
MLENVYWLGHSGFFIQGSLNVYIDPYKIKGGQAADLILITHDHHDHLSVTDLRKISTLETAIVAPIESIHGVPGKLYSVRPGQTIEIKGVPISAVSAYNVGKRFHPREKAYVGYVFILDGKIYYHAGDTDVIPEMKAIKADIAFLPVGGTYTMDAREAAQAAVLVGAQIVVPMHWGTIVGSHRDAELLRKECACQVEILGKV